MVQLFREAGLGEDSAQKAARGLADGTYATFVEAARSRALWDGGPYVSEARILQAAAKIPGAPRALAERRTPSQARTRVLERAAASIAGDARLKVCLISAGQGSSGYYPEETLKEAAKHGAFPAGLHCYVDHPTESESFNRPERSVRDLAGVLERAAVYRDGALFADVRVYKSHRDLITERAEAIGMSIRGTGQIENQVIDGTSRAVVTVLGPIASVDFVTHAGRGGRIESVA